MPRITRKSQGVDFSGKRVPDVHWHKMFPGRWVNTWGGQVFIEWGRHTGPKKYYRVLAVGDAGHSDGSFGGTIGTKPYVIAITTSLKDANKKATAWMKTNFHFNRPR